MDANVSVQHIANKLLRSALDFDARRRELGEPSSITVEMLLDVPDLRSELGVLAPNSNPETLIVLLAIRAARDVLSVWQSSYPELQGPAEAIATAEEWLKYLTPEAASIARSAAERASNDAQHVWHENKLAGWAGRTASWAGMAPSYPWAAVAALIGAVRATNQEAVEQALGKALLAGFPLAR